MNVTRFLNLSELLGIAGMTNRVKRKVAMPPSPAVQPPRNFSNLPEIERLDIRAMLAKWED